MAAGTFRDLLKSGGFQSYLWTQFLGAFNDNAFKMVVSLTAAHAAASGGSGYLPLVGVIFMLPFFLFSGHAGQLADLHSKRSVLIFMKFFEVVAMAAGIVALYAGNIWGQFFVLLLMALHSNFFSPAKYGIVPQLVGDRDMSRANALLEMTTFVAIVLGTAAAGAMFDVWKTRQAFIGVILTCVAVVGVAVSFGIPRVPVSKPGERFNWNPWAEIVLGTKSLWKDRPLWLTVMAISFFWFAGALIQMNVILFGEQVLHAGELKTGILVTFLAVGIGAGSMLAGRLSGDKVELGLVPIGAIGMTVFLCALAFTGGSYAVAAGMMVLLGLSSGLFIVPLNALLQHRSGDEEKGRLQATNNFFNTAFILAASGVLKLSTDVLHIGPEGVMVLAGVLAAGATIYILTVVPDFLVRFVLWMFTHTVYKIRIRGQENVPFRGPALLVVNHVSLVDGFLVGASIQRMLRFMVWKPYYEHPLFSRVLRLIKAIPVGQANRREIVESLRRGRAELEAGHVVCIFAEGAITRTGNLLPFRRGFEKIVAGLDCPIIPVHLGGVWGSIFSFAEGRFLLKWPRKIPFPVTVSFGRPLPSSATVADVRQAVMDLGARSAEEQWKKRDLLHVRFVRSARRRWFRFCMADSTGREMTYGQVAIASRLLARKIARVSGNDNMIGLLLPTSVGGALANIAAYLAGKKPVNLNYTAGAAAMASAVRQCGIRRIVTSRVFLTRLKIPVPESGAFLDAPEGAIFLEDLLKSATGLDKILAAATCLFAKAYAAPSDPATVIFSSGSTGEPKGVMLSHFNILANIESIAQVFWTDDNDRLVGVLPLFHAFGFAVGLWFPLVTECGVVYHPNPMDAGSIGELTAKYKGTLIISTPTFYSTYTRKIPKEHFQSLRYAITGAERLREPVATAFLEKFGTELLEGYGCTEMSPVIAVNRPDFDGDGVTQTGTKSGTVGHPLPGVAVRLVDPATFAPLPAAAEGLLLVRGPNRMLGYLGQPEKTAEVIKDGWYVTGDIVAIDEDGFLRITDRLSRFSKIAGEMVPLGKVEEAVSAVLGDAAECAVVGLPDEQKGERLAVLHTSPLSAAEIWDRLNQSELPKLWIPKREAIFSVEAIPKLGTGKTDLRGVKEKAKELTGA